MDSPQIARRMHALVIFIRKRPPTKKTMSLKTNQNLQTYLKWLVFPFSFVKPITSKQKDKFQPKQARIKLKLYVKHNA